MTNVTGDRGVCFFDNVLRGQLLRQQKMLRSFPRATSLGEEGLYIDINKMLNISSKT